MNIKKINHQNWLKNKYSSFWHLGTTCFSWFLIGKKNINFVEDHPMNNSTKCFFSDWPNGFGEENENEKVYG